MTDKLSGYRPAVWRGMTDMDPATPVAGIGLMTFDGAFQDFVLSDLELRRMVEQIVDTVPSGWAHQLRTFFQASREAGSAAVDGSMPRGVGLQSPETSLARTASGEGA